MSEIPLQMLLKQHSIKTVKHHKYHHLESDELPVEVEIDDEGSRVVWDDGKKPPKYRAPKQTRPIWRHDGQGRDVRSMPRP